MKILFTLMMGLMLGWASALCDTQGQLALEQHQQQLETNLRLQVVAPEIEENPASASFFFGWP